MLMVHRLTCRRQPAPLPVQAAFCLHRHAPRPQQRGVSYFGDAPQNMIGDSAEGKTCLTLCHTVLKATAVVQQEP